MHRSLFAAVALLALTGGAGLWAYDLTGGGAEARVQQGELTVTPSSGSVGATVVVEGQGCNAPGYDTVTILFEDQAPEGSVTVGTDPVAVDAPIDEQGRFHFTYTIPAAFAEGSRQGRGGGPLVSGAYAFVSRPVICSAEFTVTASGLPPTGSAPAVNGTLGGLPWASAFSLLGVVVAAAGFALAVRSQGRRVL